MRVRDPPVSATADEALLDRLDGDEGQDDEHPGEDRDRVVAEADGHAERGDDPDHRRGRQAAHVFAEAKDAARTEKSDAGHDLRRDSRWVDGLAEKGDQPQACEHAGARRDQRHRPHARRVAAKLTLGADRQADQEGDENTESEIELAVYPAGERRALAPAGSSPGSVLSARLILGTGLIGKLREVQTVHEVAEYGEPLLVDDGGLALLLVAVDLIRVGDDARGVHHLSRDEDRALDAHG